MFAVFLKVQSCSGLERAEGRFWELLPTGEGGVSVLLARVGTQTWSAVNAAVMGHGESTGVAQKDLSKDGDLRGNEATWMAGFLGFRILRCHVSQEPLLIIGLEWRHEIFPVSLRSLSREHKPSWKQGVIAPCFCQLGQKYCCECSKSA